MVKLLHAGMKGGSDTYATVLAFMVELGMDDPKVFRNNMQKVSRKFDELRTRMQ